MNKTAPFVGMAKSDLQSKMLGEINKRGAAGLNLQIETTEEGRTIKALEAVGGAKFKSGVTRADIRMGGRLRVGG
eukprot:CAMPEP_0201507696 /NCGR_PEP_ID=MMETSP0161_2-20130828/1289_1 /ASSEMBLY_ACC=CAM_ASM_000251 /TAXON_ID=180227 /ORGANISM="Neoparamoeba aestuarina, Strain SoJaBio B1-5/56/2" /LENGTH=74 /DNA_ID=CAMNT_0047902133 /DNA_START=77 /DNA_END=297 /DNA_ORIENTATION=+